MQLLWKLHWQGTPSNRCSCSESYTDKAHLQTDAVALKVTLLRHTFKPMQLLWKLHWQGTFKPMQLLWKLHWQGTSFKPMQLLWKLHWQGTPFKPMQLLWKLHWQGTPSNRCSCSVWKLHCQGTQGLSNRCSCSESYTDKAQPSNRCSCSESYTRHSLKRHSLVSVTFRCSCSLKVALSVYTFKPMQLLWKLQQGTPFKPMQLRKLHEGWCSCSESYTDKAHLQTDAVALKVTLTRHTFKPMQLLWSYINKIQTDAVALKVTLSNRCKSYTDKAQFQTDAVALKVTFKTQTAVALKVTLKAQPSNRCSLWKLM